MVKYQLMLHCYLCNLRYFTKHFGRWVPICFFTECGLLASYLVSICFIWKALNLSCVFYNKSDITDRSKMKMR